MDFEMFDYDDKVDWDVVNKAERELTDEWMDTLDFINSL